jgi:hypothetical protein
MLIKRLSERVKRYLPEHNRATVKLSAADQDIFCTFDNTVIYPVPNKWGKQGWTHVNLLTVREEMLTEILKRPIAK